MATKLVVPYDNPQALMGAGVIVTYDGENCQIEVKCPECGKRFLSEELPSKDVREWFETGGMNCPHVQDLFPGLDADERELFFMWHLCGGCWKKVMEGGGR